MEFLVHIWDPPIEKFPIRKKVVPITVEDVYFLTSLSMRGLPISLSRYALGGETMREYVLKYFYVGVEPSKDGKINIRDVQYFPLITILFTIVKLASTITLHVENR